MPQIMTVISHTHQQEDQKKNIFSVNHSCELKSYNYICP